jgi:hypothetical protein
MSEKTYQYLLVTYVTAVTIIISAVIAVYYGQHLAVTHHAAHYEVNSWGISKFHWNDEEAQIIIADPADSLTPPRLSK